MVQHAVGEPVELVDRLMGELGDMRAGELLLGGAALIATTAIRKRQMAFPTTFMFRNPGSF